LVILGLIGTVVGFIVALSGVDPEKAGDVQEIQPMVAVLIQGLSVALYTTLVGAILNVWLMTNYNILAGATVKLYTTIIDRN
jgi:biopolymer transport protein ExbB/TolQ